MFETLERFLTVEPAPGEFEAAASELGVRPLFVSWRCAACATASPN
jgi:hypothetical protein